MFSSHACAYTVFLSLIYSHSISSTANLCIEQVDHIVVGTVIQEVKTSNIAREVSWRNIERNVWFGCASICVRLSPSRQRWSRGSAIAFHATLSPWPVYHPTWLLQQVRSWYGVAILSHSLVRVVNSIGSIVTISRVYYM